MPRRAKRPRFRCSSRSAGAAPATAQYSLSLGPISSVQTASSTAPATRFANLPAGDDCQLVGDCNANYYPRLTVDASPIRFSAIAGGATFELPGYIRVVNDGGGLCLDGDGPVHGRQRLGVPERGFRIGHREREGHCRSQGPRPGDIQGERLHRRGIAGGQRLRAGDAGGLADADASHAAAPAPVPTPVVTVAKIVNAATFEPTPLVAGSLGTAMGTNLAGKAVSVTLDGQTAEVLYDSATQINFVVPAALRGKSSARWWRRWTGRRARRRRVILAPAWPSLFAKAS